MTVYVYNWAQIERYTLSQTKEVAMRVFRDAGVEAELLDFALTLDEEEAAAAEEVSGGAFFVHIFSREMAKPLRLRETALGLAPGGHEEHGRNMVYVFDHVAEKVAQEHQEHVLARANDNAVRPANKSQILGHAIAHEIGHVLLRQEFHSRAGLMRAVWDREDLQGMTEGSLGFSLDEARELRARVAQ
jgi:hypothetical protein